MDTEFYTYEVPAELENEKLPDIVHRLTGNSKLRHDSNCWNSTLKFHNVPVPRRWENGEDMNRWIKVNTYRCKEPLRFGDIVYIYGSGEYDISHTAVYVGNGWWWHKNGAAIAEFARLERVLGWYSGDAWHFRRVKKDIDNSMLPEVWEEVAA